MLSSTNTPPLWGLFWVLFSFFLKGSSRSKQILRAGIVLKKENNCFFLNCLVTNWCTWHCRLCEGPKKCYSYLLFHFPIVKFVMLNKNIAKWKNLSEQSYICVDLGPKGMKMDTWCRWKLIMRIFVSLLDTCRICMYGS